MTTVRLESYDGEITDLPDLCMQCGAPSSLRKSKKFAWFPPWIWILLFVCGLLPFAIVALIMTKRRTVNVPLCEEHKNHWMWRQAIVVGSFLALFAIGFVAYISLIDEQPGGNGNPFAGMLCLGVVIGLIIWLIAAVSLHVTSIRPTEITDTSITLAGVSEAFVQEYEGEWRPAPEQWDEAALERWNQRSRRPGAARPSVEGDDHIQRDEEDEVRRPPPDAFHE
ncbi:MAG TPA: hypothetical protein VH575_04725 [Gemmataceae bacterium]